MFKRLFGLMDVLRQQSLPGTFFFSASSLAQLDP